MAKIKRRVYTLSGKSEESIAMAMAVTSRSPLPFDEILSGIDEDKSSKFLEKFYITYGHGSIADSAVVHIAMENISQIAIKALEDTRLAAYQEKSTRYQILDREHTVEPEEIKKSKHRELYNETLDKLFGLYDEMVGVLLEDAREKDPIKKGEKKGAYENRIRIPVIDRCRLLLPAATMGNVAMTMSGRSIEYTIAKMLSSDIKEVKDLALDIKRQAQKELPILVKYSDPIKYLMEQKKRIAKLAERLDREKRTKNETGAYLAKYDKDALERVLIGAFYRLSGQSYYSIKKQIKSMSQRRKEKLFDEIIGNRHKRHDKPIRELELTDYTFEIICDYGAFRDLQRHRMTVQTIPPLTTSLGYIKPDGIDRTGLEKKYEEVMEAAGETYKKIAKDLPEIAQYVVPMAYKRRFIFHMNLREAFYLIELRSRPAGHISYRRISWQMWDEINKVHPYFAKHIKVDKTK